MVAMLFSDSLGAGSPLERSLISSSQVLGSWMPDSEGHLSAQENSRDLLWGLCCRDLTRLSIDLREDWVFSNSTNTLLGSGAAAFWPVPLASPAEDELCSPSARMKRRMLERELCPLPSSSSQRV